MTASRRLLSSADGKPMLSLPIERRRRHLEDGGDRDDSSGGGTYSAGFISEVQEEVPRGLHHRFRSQQLQQRQQQQQQQQQQPRPCANATTASDATPTRGATASATIPWGEEGRRRGQRRRRRRRLETSPRFPLTSSDGTHFVNADVGTPPQRVSLIVDTGSYTTAFPCVGCAKCRPGSKKPFWDPERSDTLRALDCDDCRGEYRCSKYERTCTYKQSYSEGSSWTATQMNDVLRLAGEEEEGGRGWEDGTGNNHGWPSANFGCIRKQSGMFDTQEPDGIIGLGPHVDSSVWALTERDSFLDRQFSLCLSRTGGSMVLGGFDPELVKPGASHEFTPITVDTGFYVVQVLDVALGSTTIVDSDTLSTFAGGTGTIVDSGTTDTYLPKGIFAAFDAAWTEATGKPFENCKGSSFCLELSPEEVAGFPVLSITLADFIVLKITPDRYLERMVMGNPPKAFYAPRLYLSEWSGAVLGANMMFNRSIVFDLASQRLGFADASCDGRADDAAAAAASPDSSSAATTGVDANVDGGTGVDKGGQGQEEKVEWVAESEANAAGEARTAAGGAAVTAEVDLDGQPRAGGVDAGFNVGDGGGDGGDVGDGGSGGGGVAVQEEEEEEEGQKQQRDGEKEERQKDDEDRERESTDESRERLRDPETSKNEKGEGQSRGDRSGSGSGSATNENAEDERDELGGGGELETGGGEGRVSLQGLVGAAEMACFWRVWEPCRKMCRQTLPKVHGCPDAKELRPCHTGDRCPSAKEDVHAELTFDVDLGLSNATDPAAAAAAAAAAVTATTDGIPRGETDEAVYEHRWRVRVRDALAGAVSSLLPASCGVFPGDVLVTSPPAAAATTTAAAAAAAAVAEPVVAMVHFWRPESAEFWKPEEAAFWEPREGATAVRATAWGIPQAGRCISALAAPTVASELTAHVQRELVMAGSAAAAAAMAPEVTPAEASVAELASRIRVHETGRVTVRTAPSGYRVIDKSSLLPVQQQQQQQQQEGLDPYRGGLLGGQSEDGGGGGGDVAAYLNNPAPSAGMSPMVAFAIQGIGIAVLGVVVLVAQRLRSSPSLPPTSTHRRSGRWRRMGSMSTGSVGTGVLSGGEDEEGGAGGEGDVGAREGPGVSGVKAIFGKGK